MRAGVFKVFATNHSPQSGADSLRDLLCCLPQRSRRIRISAIAICSA